MTIDGRQGSRGGASKSKHTVRIVQTSADAKLHASFEASSDGGHSFDYSESIQASKNSHDLLPSTSSSKDIIAYLKHMQRGGVTQPFGCTIAVAEGDSFCVIAYSENAPEMLGIMPQSVPSMGHPVGLALGSDVRDLFTHSSVSPLEKAASMADVSILNPITVHCRSSGKPFYAILHRIDVGLLIDFEPIKPSDVPVTAAGALQSHRLVAKAISRLQSLPGGDVNLLCDTVVEEVRELTGYDRVMAYKFHRDEHGEVVAEMRRSDLEPYLGLHYPATDIPQAARFLFMKNRVRMISNCLAPPVRVIEDDSLVERLSLSSSTLRAPHGCHAQYMQNMDSIASLVMAVVINDSEEDSNGQAYPGRRLWGLVVCHHTSPRSVPFPLRSACEFLMQVFSLQLNMELELAAQIREKHILKTQTVLCDMLLRDAPSGIMVKSPNVMDLVKCDGAALIYKNQVWLLGVTPTEAQVMDIVDWLLQHHADSSGISTDSLADAGYPGASSLGNMLCGFAAAKITSTDFLFWFRSHTAKEVKWGGAKHDPEDRDDGRRMHPRSSFKAFLEVVKRRSLPWEDVEMDAIHSLQLILRSSFQEMEISDAKTLASSRSNESKMRNLDELSTVAHEMVRLIETATAPIWAVDAHGLVNGWNLKAAELTGLPVEEAIGKSLVRELAEEISITTVERVLLRALQGEEDHNVEVHLKTFGDCKEKGAVIILVNACSSRDVEGKVVGVCFVGQDVTTQKMVMDKFTRIQGDYKTIVQSLNPLIPPIFGSDEFGFCSEWNPAMEKLSGWGKEEVLGKMLVGEVFGSLMASCRLKSQDALTKFILVLNKAMNGFDSEKFYLSFFDRQGKYVDSLLIASKRTDTDGRITGVFCFLHIASPELLQGLLMKKAKEKMDKELEYIHQELKKPLEGISFIRHLLEVTNLSDDQKQLVQTSSVCERQLRNILEDDVKNIEEGYVELDTSVFNMGTVMDAVISQCMSVSSAKGVQIIQEVPEDLKALQLFGDQARLQQALAGYISGALQHTPASEEGIEVKAMYKQRWLDDKVVMIDFEFRISHPGDGLPDSLVNEIFESGEQWTPDGLSFALSRTLLKLMNGDVQYTRGTGRNLFVISIEFPLAEIGNGTSL